MAGKGRRVTHSDSRCRISAGLAAATTVVIMASHWVSAAQQNLPLLAITSPADGTTVNPGQTVSVTVTSPANAQFRVLLLGGTATRGFDLISEPLPARVSLTIPSNARPGSYWVSLSGVTLSGEEGFAMIDLRVERADMPRSIEAVSSITFQAQAESDRISLEARFADGSVVDVTESSYLSFASLDPKVAMVDACGAVTAIDEGRTRVIVTYGPPAQGIRTEIEIIVPPPLFTVSPRSLDFGDQRVGTSSKRQMTVTNKWSGPLAFTTVTATGDFAATNDCVSSSPLAVRAICRVTVIFTPTTEGPRTGGLSIKTNFHIVPIRFELAGSGTAK